MPPPSDVFPALFSSLRDRLATGRSGSQPDHSTPLAGSVQDTLLASLSSSDQHVQRCLLQDIRHDASANRLQLLRKTRLSVRKARGANRRRKIQLQAVAAAESDTALLDALTHDRKFQFFMTETHHKAAVRLQTLFFECIAEMKKTLVRMQDVASNTTEESESMIDDLRYRYEWQLFLSRLQQDCGGDIDASLLYPRSPHDKSSIDNNLFHSPMQPGNSKLSVKVGFQRILQEHGPAMDNGNMLMVRSVTSLRRARQAPEKSNRLAPSLHFKASAGEMWFELLENMMDQKSPIKPRRAPSSSSSSTRRIRRLPLSKGVTTAPNLESIYRTGGGVCSRFRQLATETTAQFPGTACDVPLSSVYIQWMITAEFLDQASNDEPQYASVADYNIYFDVAEYEHNFAAIMQNYATSAALDETSASFPIDQAALASARRSLREISTIFERIYEQKEDHAADTIFASRSKTPSRSEHVDLPRQSQEPGVFARASVLQLIQTRYYSKSLLPLMQGEDVDILRKLYPSALFGEGCISTLYVPVVDGLREQRGASKVFMHPLTNEAIHELLLVYVARGRRDMNSSVQSNQSPASLAFSDALNMLLPCRQTGCNEHIDSRFCLIKNPRGLWKLNKEAGVQNPSEDFKSFTDADVAFAECTMSSTQVGRFGREQQERPKTHLVLETLGSSCRWRSCLTHYDFKGFKDNSNLCRWHASIQRFLEFDESMQYTPNDAHVKESLLIVESDSLVERIKRVIQTSSSLLEELSSGQLPHSIKTFYDHVANAASNRVYQAELLGTTALAEVTDGSTSIRDLEQSHDELQRLVDVSEEILGTENRATREFQKLLQLTVYPGVEDSFAQQGFFDIEELQDDIRTRDPELLLRLSQQKLQILIRRRQDEETQVIRRLGPSASLPIMSCHSSLEQAQWNDSETSSVEDVIHVMRKGRQSLTRQQRQEAQNRGLRHEFKRLSHSLEHSASDLARVSPYDTKVALAAKYRVNGGANNKRVARK